MAQQFPGSDTTLIARSLELSVVGFYSGGASNPNDGFRIFHGTEPPDYFGGDHLTQLTTTAEVLAWLDGYKVAATFKPVLVPMTVDDEK